MTAAFGAIGTKAITGTTTVATAYPTGVAAGHVAVAFRIGWTAANIAFAAETGWVQRGSQSGGTGSSADAHTTEVGTDTRELDGSESGSVTFDNGASAGGAVGVMLRYSKDVGESWEYAYSAGDDNTHGANRSVTGSTSIALAAGDIVVCGVATDTDDALTITSPAITASGITFGSTTRRSPTSAGSTAGTDGNVEVFEATVSSGSGTVAPTLAFTTATSQCGPVAFLRLRAVVTVVNTNAPAAAGSGSMPAPGVSVFFVGPVAAPAAAGSGSATVPTVETFATDRIRRIGTGTVATGTGTSATAVYPTVPGGILSTDVLVLWVFSTSSSLINIAPAGWNTTRNNANAPSMMMATRYAVGGESGNLSITVPNATWSASIDAYRGVDPSTAFGGLDSSVQIFDNASPGSSTITTTLGVTATHPFAMLLIGVGVVAGSVTFTPASAPAAFTEVRDNGTGPSVTVDELVWSGTGPAGAVTLTQSGTGAYTGMLLALRAAVWPVPAATGSGAAGTPIVGGAAEVTAPASAASGSITAPTVTAGADVSAAASGSGSITAPAVSGGAEVTAPAAGALGAIVAPALGSDATVSVPAGGATGSITAPDVGGAAEVTAPASTATGSAGAPTLTWGAELAAVPAEAVGAVTPPAVSGGADLTTPAAVALGEMPAPVVNGGVAPNVEVEPPAATGIGSAAAPTVTVTATVGSPAATGTGSAGTPIVAVAAVIATPAAGATASSTAPALTAGVNIIAPDASASGSIETPLVQVPALVLAAAGIATASATIPALSVLANIQATAMLAHGSMGHPRILWDIRDITATATLEPRGWTATVERTWKASL